MALKAKYKKPLPEAPDGKIDAYYRVCDARWHYDKPLGTFAVKSVAFSVEAFTWDDPRELLTDEHRYDEAVGSYSIPVPENGTNVDTIVDLAYAHLKTLDHFADAEDC